MFRQWAWRTALAPDDVFRHPWDWAQISAAEAAVQSSWAPVVVVTQDTGGDHAAWYDDHVGLFRGAGPPAHRALRYYQFVGSAPAMQGSAVHGTTDAEPEPTPPPDTAPDGLLPLEDHWIEVQLIDPKGNPVANELVRIELSDGSVIENQKTDKDGVLHVDLIDEDTCRITFPDLDARDYQRVG